MNRATHQLLVHGSGRVGQLVATAAKAQPDFQVVAMLNSRSPLSALPPTSLLESDVLIDFSVGTAVLPLIQHVAHAHPALRLVIGTSGWQENQAELEALVREHALYVLWGANFSVMTTAFMHLAQQAASLLSPLEGLDVGVIEQHHRHKADQPSGTALALGQQLLQVMPGKTALYCGSERPPRPTDIHLASLRLGDVAGSHQVNFVAPGEQLTLTQTSHDRSQYARGALLAARWLMQHTTPGYYSFADALGLSKPNTSSHRSANHD